MVSALVNGARSIAEAGLAVLSTASPVAKPAAARSMAAAWRAGELAWRFDARPPSRPSRPAHPVLLPPADMPKRRKAGNLQNRIALLHAVAHIEFNAIDLATDIIVRFGAQMPRAFTDDWVAVADDESRHFALLQDRLQALGSHYGALPAHDGLWQSALDTADDVAARLAVVPMVLEARGLDVTPSMIDRMDRLGDPESAAALRTIYTEEVAHVAAGNRWFDWLCDGRGLEPKDHFQALIRSYFRGTLKRPFNMDARDRAGLSRDWYEPLADILS